MPDPYWRPVVYVRHIMCPDTKDVGAEKGVSRGRRRRSNCQVAGPYLQAIYGLFHAIFMQWPLWAYKCTA